MFRTVVQKSLRKERKDNGKTIVIPLEAAGMKRKTRRVEEGRS